MPALGASVMVRMSGLSGFATFILHWCPAEMANGPRLALRPMLNLFAGFAGFLGEHIHTAPIMTPGVISVPDFGLQHLFMWAAGLHGLDLVDQGALLVHQVSVRLAHGLECFLN